MVVVYAPPGVTVRTGSASNTGGNNQAGLTVAVPGSFPKGPCWPVGTLPGTAFPTPYPVPAPASYLAASKQQALGTWGDDANGFNGPAGWTGPENVRLLYEASTGQFTPLVLPIRVGCTQASGTLPNSGGGAAWTATALLTLGGTMGNGIICEYTGNSSSTVTAVTNTANPTITTSSAHSLQPGVTVTIASVVGATGVNGTWVVQTVPTATTFTIATGAPGVWASGGTVTASPAFAIIVPASGGAASAGYASEVWSVGASATWAQIATVVNGASKLIYLNSAVADTAALAATTAATLASGADGANPTLSQINAGVDSLLNLGYDTLPIHMILNTFPDTGTGGALQHALGDAIAMLPNGQRPRVFGGISPAAGGTGNLTTILAMAAALVPSENGGDSGRCVFWTNGQPYRIDPQTNSERLYSGAAPAASHAGLEASSPVSQGFGRSILPGFTRFADNYTVAERKGPTGLYANGAMVVNARGRMEDQVTTAISTSYRRDDNIDRAENWWVADLGNYLQNTAIEIAAGPSAGLTIEDLTDGKMRGYVEDGVLAGYSITVTQKSQDARQWEVDVAYEPFFLVRNINPLSVQLTAPASIALPTLTLSLAA